MTPCLGCVSSLLCRDERVHKNCLVCCSAPSHTLAFSAALQPSPIITDARSGSLIYILCHIWRLHTFYLLPCVLSLVCLLSAEHSVLSPKHTHTHRQSCLMEKARPLSRRPRHIITCEFHECVHDNWRAACEL